MRIIVGFFVKTGHGLQAKHRLGSHRLDSVMPGGTFMKTRYTSGLKNLWSMIHRIYSHPMALDRIRILFEVTNERISQIFNQILLGAVRCEGKFFSPFAAGHRPYQRPRSVHCTLPPTPAVSAREHSQRPPSRAKLFEAFHFRGLLGHAPSGMTHLSCAFR